MLLRIWKTEVVEDRASEFEDFGKKYTTPTFKRYSGFIGVLYNRSGTFCATISIWTDKSSIQTLESSKEYQNLVEKIKKAGFLRGDQITEVYDLKGGFIYEKLLESL